MSDSPLHSQKSSSHDEKTADVLLVSIGNFGGARPVNPEAPRATCLLKLGFDTEIRAWVDVGCSDNPLVAGLGLCTDNRYVYHVSLAKIDSRSILTVLDRRTLNVVHVQALMEVADVHSIQCLGDELIVVSTGTDQIIGYQLDDAVAHSARVLWTPTNSGRDEHHVNSLAVMNDELICSAFGPAEGGTWATAKNGYIQNVTTDTRLVDHLIHPHSVTIHNRQIYYCQSPDGTVSSLDGVVGYFAGYTRGLAFGVDGTMYVGTSLSRRTTQGSSGPIEFHNLGFVGALTGQCAVARVSPTQTRFELSTSAFGLEIYDILVL
jgi:hypothetical protein